MNYIEVKIPKPADPIRCDLLVAELGEAGFESFAEEEDALLAYIPEPDYNPEILFEHLKDDVRPDQTEVKLIGDRNWNEVWESNYPPVLIDGRCSIRAPFHESPGEVEYDILLKPKMAFGTAHHETTAMMISLMLDEDFSGKRVLDMGCGTGVLAILAKMKETSGIVTIDIDSWTFENATENVALNSLTGIEIEESDASLLAGNAPFDIILANINKNILLSDIPIYAAGLRAGGRLYLSGFYDDDVYDISQSCAQNGLKFVWHKTKNKWTAAIYQKQ